MNAIRNALLGSLLVMGAWSSLPAMAQTADKGRNPEVIRPAFPEIALAAKEAAGQKAIDMLGARLPAVAAWYGKSPRNSATSFCATRPSASIARAACSLSTK